MSLLSELVPGVRWVRVLDVVLPMAPQSKERARAALRPPKGSPRDRHLSALVARHLGRPEPTPEIHHYTPDATEDWTAAAAMVLGSHWRASGRSTPHRHHPVRVDVVARFEPPDEPKHPVFHVVRPDRDNLDKIVLDSLVRADVLVDDAQVCAGEPLKLYAAPGERPSVRVVLSLLELE